MGMKRRRLAELTALMMVGDGVLTAVGPERHVGLWSCGPQWYKRVADRFAERPRTTRMLGVAAAAAGIYWASRQQPERRRRFLGF
jgi:hypothetical protein